MRTLTPLLLLLALAACGERDEQQGRQTAPGAPTVAQPPPAELAVPRRIELAHGGSIEILSEGEGPALGAGDEVLLDYTLSYVPRPEPPAEATPPTDENAGLEKGAGSRPSRTKPAPKQAAPAEPASSEQPASAEGIPSEEPASAKGAPSGQPAPPAGGEQAPGESPAPSADAPPADVAPAVAVQTDAVPADASPADTAQAGAAPADAAPAAEAQVVPAPGEAAPVDEAQAPAAAPADPPAEAAAPPSPEPVILASTREMPMPLRVRLGTPAGAQLGARGSAPVLLPGLSRALIGLRSGTRARITLPPELAYGTQGDAAAGVPPGTTLLCEVHVRRAP